jgi:alpha-galactosidase
MRAAALLAAAAGQLAPCVLALDNGLALTPPLGWRSFNAFWGIIDQVKMEGTMDMLANHSVSRLVGGKPT